MPIETLINAVKHWAERTFATRGELKQVASSESVEAIESSIEAVESSIEAVESQIESMEPDWDAEEGEPGYIKNKPFRLDGVTQRVTLPETSVTTSKYAIYPYPRGNIYPPEQFIIGATYHVTFEGETYTCVCRKYESGPVHIGNGKYDSESDGNGEPFLLWANGVQGTFYLCTEKAGTYTVAASVDEPKYKTLSEVYLPADALVGHLGEDGEIFNDYENNVASGGHSHAEGVRTTASGYGSHAEGEWSTASGSYSHAEGTDTIADHNGAHAEGCGSSATGPFSHAEGYHTTAASDEQHVQGRYNVVDSERVYAHIVGNGKNNSLAANIHTIDWIGNGWFSGNLYVGGTSKDEAFPVGFVTHTETYTFDGDTSGRDTFVLNNADFYKVADAPDMKSIVDWTVTKVNVTQEDISNNTISITMDEGRARCFGEYVFVVSVSGTVKLTTFDYAYTYSVNVPSPGVYVMWDKFYGQVTELKLTLGTPMVEVVSALESRITALEVTPNAEGVGF